MTTPPGARERAKAERREAIRDAAARQFAQRGFAAVSLDDIGGAVGVSGPAIYRHFSGKQALLEDLLVSVSASLAAGGSAVRDSAATARAALDELIAFHVAFALDSPDVIRVQDRDLTALDAGAREHVRALQRRYVDVWVSVLGDVIDVDEPERRLRVHAVFGLINSTPHASRAARTLGRTAASRTLAALARAALLAGADERHG